MVGQIVQIGQIGIPTTILSQWGGWGGGVPLYPIKMGLNLPCINRKWPENPLRPPFSHHSHHQPASLRWESRPHPAAAPAAQPRLARASSKWPENPKLRTSSQQRGKTRGCLNYLLFKQRQKQRGCHMAMGQNPNRLAPSEPPNPTTKIGSKMGGEFAYQPTCYHWF